MSAVWWWIHQAKKKKKKKKKESLHKQASDRECWQTVCVSWAPQGKHWLRACHSSVLSLSPRVMGEDMRPGCLTGLPGPGHRGLLLKRLLPSTRLRWITSYSQCETRPPYRCVSMSQEWQLGRNSCFCYCLVSRVCLFCNPIVCSPPGCSVHGILQARILEWVAISFSRGSSQPRDRTWVSCIAGGFFITDPPRKP